MSRRRRVAERPAAQARRPGSRAPRRGRVGDVGPVLRVHRPGPGPAPQEVRREGSPICRLDQHRPRGDQGVLRAAQGHPAERVQHAAADSRGSRGRERDQDTRVSGRPDHLPGRPGREGLLGRRVGAHAAPRPGGRRPWTRPSPPPSTRRPGGQDPDRTTHATARSARSLAPPDVARARRPHRPRPMPANVAAGARDALPDRRRRPPGRPRAGYQAPPRNGRAEWVGAPGGRHRVRPPGRRRWRRRSPRSSWSSGPRPRRTACSGVLAADARAVVVPGYLAQFRITEADTLTANWVAADPGDARGWQYRADVLERLERQEPARPAYARWVEAAPDDCAARLGFGRTMLGTRRAPTDTAPHLDRLLADTPNDPTVLRLLAALCETAVKGDETAAVLGRAVAGPAEDRCRATLTGAARTQPRTPGRRPPAGPSLPTRPTWRPGSPYSAVSNRPTRPRQPRPRRGGRRCATTSTGSVCWPNKWRYPGSGRNPAGRWVSCFSATIGRATLVGVGPSISLQLLGWVVTYFRCAAGYASHSPRAHTRSANPAAIAGVRFRHRPSTSTRRGRTGQQKL